MGLFDAIFRLGKDKEQQKAVTQAREYFKTLTAYRPVFHTWQGSIYESELIRAAIGAKARHISKLKFEPVGSAKTGLQSKLKQGPNQYMTWPQFLSRVSTILDVHNTAFIVPVKDDDLITTGYYPVLPTSCEVVEYKNVPWVRISFNHGQKGAVRASECVILTQYQYKSDFFGENNTALEPTLKMLDLNEQGISEAIKNGATFRFWAKMGNFAMDEDLRKEAERFGKMSFADESSGMLLFPNTYTDIHQYNNAPYTVDAEQMKLINENIFNYFGVNEDILQNKAVGDSWAAFYEGCVEVFAVALSDAMTKAMFTERERSNGNRVMFTSNRLQYMSNAEKRAITETAADRGLMSRDEIREIWNLPPLPNGLGKTYTLRGEYYLVDEDGNIIKKADDGMTETEETQNE